LKQVHPDTGISNKAMAILNSIANQHIVPEASKLASYYKKYTAPSQEIQTFYIYSLVPAALLLLLYSPSINTFFTLQQRKVNFGP